MFVLEKELRGTKNVTGGQKRDSEPANVRRLAERQDMLMAFARQARLHQARWFVRKQ